MDKTCAIEDQYSTLRYYLLEKAFTASLSVLHNIEMFWVYLIENMYIVTANFVGKMGLLEQHLNKTNSTNLLRKINYERKSNGLYLQIMVLGMLLVAIHLQLAQLEFSRIQQL